jgi:hypothetical protein
MLWDGYRRIFSMMSLVAIGCSANPDGPSVPEVPAAEAPNEGAAAVEGGPERGIPLRSAGEPVP